jgi:hypothetical protein
MNTSDTATHGHFLQVLPTLLCTPMRFTIAHLPRQQLGPRLAQDKIAPLGHRAQQWGPQQRWQIAAGRLCCPCRKKRSQKRWAVPMTASHRCACVNNHVAGLKSCFVHVPSLSVAVQSCGEKQLAPMPDRLSEGSPKCSAAPPSVAVTCTREALACLKISHTPPHPTHTLYSSALTSYILAFMVPTHGNATLLSALSVPRVPGLTSAA